MGILDRFRKSQDTGVSANSSTSPGHSRPPNAHSLTPTLPTGSTVSAVGESYYEQSFIRICGPRCADGYHLAVVAELRPEPTNPYDANAIAVHVHGLPVGHLSREHAIDARPVVDKTISTHGFAACDAIIRGGWDRGHGDVGNFGIQLKCSLFPSPFPELGEAEFRLAPGDQVSVSHEEHYQETLQEVFGRDGFDGPDREVLVGLVIADRDPWKKTDTGPVIEVQLDGQTVGYLTPAMTARYRPIVDRALAQDRLVTSQASILRSAKKDGEILEVQLNAGNPTLRQ